VYARDVEADPQTADEAPGPRTLTLVVSGMLWERSLVMKDLETESLWSHLLGEAMDGPLVGTRLETLPAVMTDWETWKKRHPHTTVAHLSRTAHFFRREMYDAPERFVIGFAQGGAARAWPFDQLAYRPLLNDEVALDDPSNDNPAAASTTPDPPEEPPSESADQKDE